MDAEIMVQSGPKHLLMWGCYEPLGKGTRLLNLCVSMCEETGVESKSVGKLRSEEIEVLPTFALIWMIRSDGERRRNGRGEEKKTEGVGGKTGKAGLRGDRVMEETRGEEKGGRLGNKQR